MRVWLLCLALLIAITASRYSWSQVLTTEAVQAKPAGARPSGAVPPGAKPPTARTRPAPPNSAKKKPAAKPGADKGKPGEEKPKVVQRPDKPSTPADPKELKVQLDDDGLVQFSFRGQTWPDVVEWLAGVSHMSLDWQELPSDYLNLTTQRRYTIDESRDLINRHLLARGFTMLVNGEVLSVTKIDQINHGMVPRIHPHELAERMPNEFAKVSFQLDWLLAEQTAEELKPMISPNGKLHALKNTNRLEAMDSIANLREIYAVLQQEQSSEGEARLIKEFPLLYTRATDVIEQLEKLLGIESKSAAPPMTPQQQAMMRQQQQRARARAAQQAAQRGGKPQPQSQKKEAKVNLVANPRKNSILAHAPPDKMAIIKQAVQVIDVRSDRRNSLIGNPNRIQVYRLHALDPETLVTSLEDLGDLDPTTRLDVDTKNKAVIAIASLADHVMIRQLIAQLDGSSRRFEVIRLRRLAADYVAGTVEFMMVGEKEDKQQNNRYSYFSYRSNSSQEDESKDEFRVDADLENNYLLLWASEIEIEEVMNLLVKLGEIPPEGGRQTKMRVLDAISEQEAAKFLERLRQAWPSLAPNRLNLPVAPPTDSKDATESKAGKTKAKEARLDRSRPSQDVARPALSKTAQIGHPVDRTFTVSLFNDEADADVETQSNRPTDQAPVANPNPRRNSPRRQDNAAGAGEPPPVQVSITPDGRLVITSDDTQALDLLEELIAQLAPRAPDYKIYRMKFADAYWVILNLKEFFEEEDEEKQPSNYRYYYYDPPQQKEESRFRLSKRKKLKFIYDVDTNSILVQGADTHQLKTIEDLIAIYDQAEPVDSQSARLSQVFPIQHSKAQVIADTIKDVYRDLLSTNDKALANNPEKKERGPVGGTTFIYGNGGTEGGSERTQIRFKGKLSVGIDSLSNTLVVSTEGRHLMENVAEMIRTLDQAAKPVSKLSVLRVGPGVNATKVSEVLSKLLTDPQPTPNGKQQNQPQQGANPRQGQGNQGRNVRVAPNG